MSRYRLEFLLKQQTPMLHFQSEEAGACLRPSEVKPRLDEFVHQWVKNQNARIADPQQHIMIPIEWFIDKEKHHALDYKMQITGRPRSEECTIKSYFGNTGANAQQMKCVLFDDSVAVNITSFKTETINLAGASIRDHNNCHEFTLLEFLDGILSAFFATTNFGMRKTKGFGSFARRRGTGIKPFSINITDRFPVYYYIEYQQLPNKNLVQEQRIQKQIMNDIRIISGLMKSGFNLSRDNDYYKGWALRYLRNQQLGNDKAFIKRFVLPGNGNEHPNCRQKSDCDGKDESENFRFIRAMLGLPNDYQYRDNVRRGNVTVKSNVVERFAAPITFKLVVNRLYIFPQEIPEAMLDSTFKLNRQVIKTPSADEFGLIHFIDCFIKEFNAMNQKQFNSRNLAFAENNLKIVKVGGR